MPMPPGRLRRTKRQPWLRERVTVHRGSKRVKRLAAGLSALAFVLAWGRSAWPVTEIQDAASAANAFLDIGADPRASAMGGAYTALAQEASSIYWNPAGLGALRRPQLLLMHNQWFENIIHEYAAAALPLGAGALGVSATWVHYGTLERIDDVGQTLGQFSAYDMCVAAAYGVPVSSHMSVGAAVNVPWSSVDNQSWASVGADAGLQVVWPGLPALRLGLAVKNIGTKIGDAVQPSHLSVGGSYTGLANGLTVALDLSKRLFERHVDIRLGADYLVQDLLALRIGYMLFSEPSALGSGMANLTAGMGVHVPFDGFSLGLDYAFVPYGDLGSTHRIALILTLGEPRPASATVSKTTWASPGVVAAPPAPAVPQESPGEDRVRAALRPPDGVRVENLSSGRLRVSWRRSASAAAHGYHVYMRKDRGPYRRVTDRPVRTLSCILGAPSGGHRYDVIVKTLDSRGLASDASEAVSIRLK